MRNKLRSLGIVGDSDVKIAAGTYVTQCNACTAPLLYHVFAIVDVGHSQVISTEFSETLAP
jgi:hypothetical protein